MKIKLLTPVHSFSSNCYFITSGDEAAVVDPSVPYDESLVTGSVKYILLTHSHFDHILEIDSWVNATGAEVIISEKEIDFLSDPNKNCFAFFDGSTRGYFGKARGLSDGEELRLGEETFRVMHLPGHTQGSVAYLFDGNAFVGDTVFAGGGFGRWDLPSGDMRELFNSIQQVKQLPDDTALFCGHGEPTTVGQYKIDTNR